MKKILFMLAFSLGITLLSIIFMFITGREFPGMAVMLIAYIIVNIIGICLGYHKKLWEDLVENKAP